MKAISRPTSTSCATRTNFPSRPSRKCPSCLTIIVRAIAKEFCNEILAQRVFLGKWQHAKDGQMITTLGITHILNISDSCENYLEDTHRKCGSING